MPEIITDVVKPRPLEYTLDDYWKAPSGNGPLAGAWANKPTQLYYDLLAALLKAGTERVSGTIIETSEADQKNG